ncbi:MAG: cytochrome b/b6 domain-containing protein [Thaumarchaeota archaeon]|nr:cytochrome b/b6 domain-containing protein [Nitrososphaerota archaeon]
MTHTTNPSLILGIVLLFGVAAVVHIARRYRLMHATSAPSEEISFDKLQRTLHWAIGIGVVGLIITGLPVYLAQFLVNPPTPNRLQFVYWGMLVFNWRSIHIDLALLVVALVVVHASWDAYHLRTAAKIRVTKRDFWEAIARSRNFLGLTREYLPPGAKYDFFQKMFHWSLIILGAFLLASGLLTWEAITWQGIPLFVWLDRINHPFMDSFIRTGHLVAATLVFGLVGLHAYFALLPQNKNILRAITTGAEGKSQE